MGGKLSRCTADLGRGRVGRGTSSGMLWGAVPVASDMPVAWAGAVEDVKAPGGVRSSPEPDRSRGSIAGTARVREEIVERLKGWSRDLRLRGWVWELAQRVPGGLALTWHRASLVLWIP